MNRFGIITTIIYTCAILLLRWSSIPELATMPLNEFGDFLAGVFGPLMLFWLILGYMQQQKELAQNTAALQLQASELKESVEQQKELVKATREQVQADLKALEIEQIRSFSEKQPVFSILKAGFRSSRENEFTFEIIVTNSGPSAHNVRYSTIPEIKQIRNASYAELLDSGETCKINWKEKSSDKAPQQLKFMINCNDSNARPYY